MNDAELAEILPKWSELSRKKQDKIFREYQQESFGQGISAEDLQMLEERTAHFEHERFLRLLPIHITNRDYMGLTAIMEDEWTAVFHADTRDADSRDERECLQLALDAWDRAGLAFLNALDYRDPMLSIHLIGLLEPILRRVGRAASLVRKSPKFAPFITYALAERGSVLAAIPIQCETIKMLSLLLWKIPKGFLQRLQSAKTIETIVDVFDGCCPSLMNQICLVLERLLAVAYEHSNDGAALDPSLGRLFHRVAQITNAHILATDMNQERFRNRYKMEAWTDITDVVGPLCNLLQTLAATLKIPVPMEVRQKLKPFGAKYTNRPPTNPVERARWSDRYVAMRVAEVDWSSSAMESESREIVRVKAMQYDMFEKSRRRNIQCAACQKQEDLDTSEERLSKCSKCMRAYYCSRECQTGHWPKHRKTCRKPPQSSLPEPLLALGESVRRGHAIGTSHGNTFYPCMFAVWLDWKYNRAS